MTTARIERQLMTQKSFTLDSTGLKIVLFLGLMQSVYAKQPGEKDRFDSGGILFMMLCIATMWMVPVVFSRLFKHHTIQQPLNSVSPTTKIVSAKENADHKNSNGDVNDKFTDVPCAAQQYKR